MKKVQHFFILLSLLLIPTLRSQAKSLIDPALRNFFANHAQENVEVLALLPSPFATLSDYKNKNSSQVLNTLKNEHRLTFEQLNVSRTFLRLKKSGDITAVNYFWINNSIAAKVTRRGLRFLSKQQNIIKIYKNKTVKPLSASENWTSMSLTENWPTEPLYHIHETHLDQLIETFPEIDGRGILIGSIDTGVDPEHEALKGKISGFINLENSGNLPVDFSTHGTHTIGLIVGGDRQQRVLGVAPGAKVFVMALKTYSRIIAAMQLTLDPDGQTETNDGPRVVNNSWHAEGAPDIELFYRALTAWELCGITSVFSAGNRGPDEDTVTAPKEHPSAIVVGATGPDGLVAKFSSRGPTHFRGTKAFKPSLTAPGVNIISSLPDNNYGAWSGTSMAAPQVTGTVALMLQAQPNLLPKHIRQILRSSVDNPPSSFIESPNNWSPAYGYGKLNILKAVNGALDFWKTLPLPLPIRSLGLLGALENLPADSQDLQKTKTLPESLKFPKVLDGTDWIKPSDEWWHRNIEDVTDDAK